MKESKFMELLNLYIDQQISPADAGLLEDDIQHDVRHRRIYQEYCRMHRACTMVLENLGDAAEPAAAGAEARADRVIDFSPRARRRGWGYAVAALAAAACVAFVAVQVIQRPAQKPSGPGLVAGPAAASVPQAPALAAANGPVRIDAPAYQDRGLPTTAFVTRRLALGSPGNLPAAASPVMISTAPDGALLPAMPVVSGGANPLRPSIEEFVFQTPAASAGSPQIYRGRRSTDAEVERTAYQFKR